MDINFLDDDIEKFIFTLEKSTIAKILRTIDLLEQFGYKLGLPHSKKITKQLFELRICGKNNVRIFYTFHKNNIILLYGFVKKTQRLPKKELEMALKKIREV